jgi:chromosome segregation ATPase
MSEQEMNLASILAIVTNPEMVAKNIQKLQADMAKASVALDAVSQEKAKVEARHAAAKAIEDGAESRHNSLNARDVELKKQEQHWLEKDTAQKAAEKAFNEEKIQHANRVRECSQQEEENAKRADSLDAREAQIKVVEAQTKQLNDEAAALKKAYEDKIESIKSFASKVG